jgi:ribose 5-phosphate isomerase A
MNAPKPSHDTQAALKKEAAEYAVRYIASGMTVGLGTGSTAIFAIRHIGALLKSGELKNIVGFATSKASWDAAVELNIPMLTEDLPKGIDVTIDGADEVDLQLNLIKGGGGALLREKIVATASDRMIVIADESKWVETLGRFPLPVEVIPFGLAATQRAIAGAFAETGVSGQMVVRKARDGHVFVTDGGHWIVDAHLGRITDPPRLATLLAAIPGVVEHGLFIGVASTAMLAGSQRIRVVERR